MDEYEVMLTTVDNPWNPFNHFKEWDRCDREKGYDTCSRIARLYQKYLDQGEPDNDETNLKVINRFIELDPFGLYIKARPEPGDLSNEEKTGPHQESNWKEYSDYLKELTRPVK